AGSERLTATANSQKVEKGRPRGCARCALSAGGSERVGGSAKARDGSSVMSGSVTLSCDAAAARTPLSRLQSISSGVCGPVYSANSAVPPHGFGVPRARAYSGLNGLLESTPIAVASRPLILASTTFDQSPWMQIKDVPAGFRNA